MLISSKKDIIFLKESVHRTGVTLHAILLIAAVGHVFEISPKEINIHLHLKIH